MINLINELLSIHLLIDLFKSNGIQMEWNLAGGHGIVC